MNSPPLSHLTGAPFKGKPCRQKGSRRKDVIPTCAAWDTSSSWENTLLLALPSGESLESGQLRCRAMPNVLKPLVCLHQPL